MAAGETQRLFHFADVGKMFFSVGGAAQIVAALATLRAFWNHGAAAGAYNVCFVTLKNGLF